MNLDEEIIEKIKQFIYENEVAIEKNQDSLIKILNENFYFLGSKIDWSKTKNHWRKDYNQQNITVDNLEKLTITRVQLENEGFNEVIERFSNVFYINDSSLDFGLKISKKSFWDIFEILIINVPQHHYFFPPDGSWCLAITMGGFIDYGESNK
ncbi:hypothetical protein [Paracidovorax avenae]|nr:hypothetical protein [Paracidovorax avenae]